MAKLALALLVAWVWMINQPPAKPTVSSVAAVSTISAPSVVSPHGSARFTGSV
ncbi:hypothetical protein AB0M95_10130 [Sphaerisporangium sp. NPDC051017]|uniref:hypothetical protein n=1 Tax=Sphaerisporangium sp. NPDC051017 TaxID=3154636 RepID=UPI00342E4F45